MTRFLVRIALVGALAFGCSESHEMSQRTYGGTGRVASTRGGAIVMTGDERVAVATHREAGIVSVLHLDPTRDVDDLVRGKPIEFDVGIEARPWAAVIGEDDDTAYVLLRGTSEVVRLKGLHDHPKLERLNGVRVGVEPTDLAITPSGRKIYVANFGEGTVSMITTEDFEAQQFTDLNFALNATGVLGVSLVWTNAELRTVRPGLAHPRALALTDDGDTTDEDEILYVTEFFSQAIPNTLATDPDQQRQGFVYAVSMETGQLRVQEQNPIPLPPVRANLVDAEGLPTFCFPNQLYGAAVAGERLYVTSVCASPRGPVGLGPGDSTVNFRTMVHGAVFVVDTSPEAQSVVGEQSGALTAQLSALYERESVSDRRMPLIPNDIALAESDTGVRAYVTALGADAVFPVDFGPGIAPDPHYIDLRPAGRLPLGIALSRGSSPRFALVLNEYSRTLSVVSLNDRQVADVFLAKDAEGIDEAVREGHRQFATGLDIWSFQGQALSSCESCHPEGQSDQVVWRFPRGPRRTISTAGTYFPDGVTRRMLLWTANADEIHDVEAITRGVSGGVGGVLWNPYSRVTPNKDCRLLYDGTSATPVGGVEACPGPESTTYRLNGLNGSLSGITRQQGTDTTVCAENQQPCDINASLEWDHIDAYIASLAAPRAPEVCRSTQSHIASACLSADRVEAGAAIFARAKCAACHGGPGWTVSRVFYTPNGENNGELPYAKPAVETLDAEGTMLASLRGELRVRTYDAGPLGASNPLAMSARATFRSWAPAADAADAKQAALDHLYGPDDQINCVLRDVGTFPVQEPGMPANLVGVVPLFTAPIQESRRTLAPLPKNAPPGTLPTYSDTLALGKDGFNVPSLVGLAMGGPMFHAGNARTLEAVFDSKFAAHHANAVLAPALSLTADEVQALVSYLISIDDDKKTVAVPSPATGELDFDPDLCAQFMP